MKIWGCHDQYHKMVFKNIIVCFYSLVYFAVSILVLLFHLRNNWKIYHFANLLDRKLAFEHLVVIFARAIT